MKRTLLKSALFLACFVLLFSCRDPEEKNGNDLEQISLSHTEMRVRPGAVVTLEVRAVPSTADVGRVTWTSSNPAVAIVGSDGRVIALSEGTADIRAEAQHLTAVCRVFVSDRYHYAPAEDVSGAVMRLPRDPYRGVGFGFRNREDVLLLDPAIGWSYNWTTHPRPEIEELFRELGHDFFPMVWSGLSDAGEQNIRDFIARNPHIRYIQAFNEPMLTDQANLTPTQAAERWPRFRNLANELGLKIVSPSLNWGTMPGFTDANVWFDAFLAHPNVSLDDIDVISVHSYAGMFGLKYFINRFRRYERPIWVTEWNQWYGTESAAQQMAFMSQSIQLMQADPMVTRHAWFYPRAGTRPPNSPPFMDLLDRNQPPGLTPLGEVFVNLSSQDRTIWQSIDNHILLAHTYTNTSASETEFRMNGTIVLGPPARPTTDDTGHLELHNMRLGQWVEYQIDVTRPVSIIRLRYANFIASSIEVSLNGDVVSTVALPYTGGDRIWNTATADISLPQGRHTIRLRVTEGGFLSLNWMKIE